MAAMLDDALAAAVGLLGWAVADDAAGAAVLPFELKLLEQALAARAIPAAMTAAAIRFLIGCSLVVTRVRKHHSPSAPGCVWSLSGTTCAAPVRFSGISFRNDGESGRS